MQLQFFNCPQPESLDSLRLPEKMPEFLIYKPDWLKVKDAVKAYGKYKNLLVIAHGGSITSFFGMYYSLLELTDKRAYFLSTVDPDYIYQLKNELKPHETLVVAISKSGETTTQIEALLHFIEYPLLFVTGKSSPLAQIAGKLNASVISHPPIGGRYTAFTEVGVLPAALVGLPAEQMFKGAEEFYAQYNSDNLAWRAASVMWQLEQAGYVDVFMPFYAHGLYSFSNLIVQLCHESFGKEGRGQTYAAFEAPESQHHTNQRFFGGHKNMAGFFVSQENFLHYSDTLVPTQLQSVEMKGQHLIVLNKIPLQKSLTFELEGTMEDARINGIPLAHLSLTSADPKTIGSFIAFWQMYAVYASLLRQVNPFDQPQVENSKQISFNKRLSYKGLL